MVSGAAHVLTIPPGIPFVDALASGLKAEAGETPGALARYLVLLPTRRACRALSDAFLRLSGGTPMVLPRTVPLGDVDEDEIALLGSGTIDEIGIAPAVEIPPAIPALRRQMLLTGPIRALDPDLTLDQAARLAAELGRFLDQVRSERLNFDRLAGIVPDGFAVHWQKTLKFLKVITEHWPGILDAEGCIDAADRRNRLLATQADLWARCPPEGKVVAAGSTGSMPATADLLAVVAALPEGRVILPGLDRDAESEIWDALEPTHPQYGMARLLDRLGIDRGHVGDWPVTDIAGTVPSRARLVNRALRPAAATENWRDGMEEDLAALEGLIRVECPGPQEEAAVIALLMRKNLETPDESVALVTPDRDLARRVAGDLARWGIAVDDSAGAPLGRTPRGALLRLVAEAVAADFAPVPLLALLKHPLVACGSTGADFRRRVRELERAVLRGPRPRPGLSGLRAAVESRGGKADLKAFLDVLDHAFAPFLAVAEGEFTVPDLVRRHVLTSERLTATVDQPGPERLWLGDDGEAAATFVSEFRDSAEVLPRISIDRYPALWDAFTAGCVVRSRYGAHPRLHILGLLEARLQHADVMILGGLNEGTWPPDAVASPWMSRPMLEAFGLPQPERRIGLTAHDFVQGFCARRVVLTRAARVDGTPTVPSRWLMRIENLLHETPLEHSFRSHNEWLAWCRQLDAPGTPVPIRRPAPRPPVSSRPRRLSVTQIETWMRDPYAIFARHILELSALDPLDADPGAADYGNLIHGALEDFMTAYPDRLPPDAEERLIRLGEGWFSVVKDRPEIWSFWWPRFLRVAEWVVAAERERRLGVVRGTTEVKGALDFDSPAGSFTLTAKADRIDLREDGTLAILDYKTGVPPRAAEIAAGFAPQLPLEAAIAAAGGFAGLPGGRVSALEFWHLKGGNPAGEVRRAGDDPMALAAQALEGLKRLVARFDFDETPYEARPRPDMAPRYSDYEHLARIKEWATGEEDDSG